MVRLLDIQDMSKDMSKVKNYTRYVKDWPRYDTSKINNDTKLNVRKFRTLPLMKAGLVNED